MHLRTILAPILLAMALSPVLLIQSCQTGGDGWIESTCAKKNAPKGSPEYNTCRRQQLENHRRLLHQGGGGGP